MNDMIMARSARVLRDIHDDFVPRTFAGGAELVMTAYAMALLDAVKDGHVADGVIDGIVDRADEYLVELMKQAGIKA